MLANQSACFGRRILKSIMEQRVGKEGVGVGVGFASEYCFETSNLDLSFFSNFIKKSPGIGQNAKRTLSSKPGTLCLVIFLSEDVSPTPGRH